MKSTIRNEVFETASSAVHSLSISHTGIESSKLPINKDGYILADFGQFGKERRYYSSQSEKLSYLLTECYYLNHYDVNIEESYLFKEIEEAICEYTGAKGIFVRKQIEPEIDHQEIPAYNDLHFCNAYDHDDVINFVFNKYVSIKTDCD